MEDAERREAERGSSVQGHTRVAWSVPLCSTDKPDRFSVWQVLEITGTGYCVVVHGYGSDGGGHNFGNISNPLPIEDALDMMEGELVRHSGRPRPG